jgi:hypothetical protein
VGRKATRASGRRPRASCTRRPVCASPPEQLRGPVALTRGAKSFQGVDYWAEEAFFFLRVSEWAVSAANLSPLERELVTGHRWWSYDELANTGAIVFPRGLGPLLARLLVGDYPQQPVELPW